MNKFAAVGCRPGRSDTAIFQRRGQKYQRVGAVMVLKLNCAQASARIFSRQNMLTKQRISAILLNVADSNSKWKCNIYLETTKIYVRLSKNFKKVLDKMKDLS